MSKTDYERNYYRLISSGLNLREMKALIHLQNTPLASQPSQIETNIVAFLIKLRFPN